MRKRWYVLAVLAGAITSVVTAYWPTAPIWVSGPDAGGISGISHDGKILVATRVYRLGGTILPKPEVSRWEMETGKLLTRTELICSPASHFHILRELRPSGDGRLVLVSDGQYQDPKGPANSAMFETGDWYLHDGLTGMLVAGPISGVAQIAFPDAFSPDGRWFLGRRGDPRGGYKSLGGIAIFDSSNGEDLNKLADRDGLQVTDCYFAPDGETAALSCIPKQWEEGKSRSTIQVIELPSGRVQRQFDLPLRKWMRFGPWDGRYFQAFVQAEGDSSRCLPLRKCVFDAAQNPAGEGVEDPHLVQGLNSEGKVAYSTDGPGWRVEFTELPSPAPLSKFDQWLDSVATRLGVRRHRTSGMDRSVRFVDPAKGSTRYALPVPLGFPCYVSHDGRRIAATTDQDGFEVWDADPWPRWPFVLTGSLAASIGMLSVGKWRHRASRRIQEPITGPTT